MPPRSAKQKARSGFITTADGVKWLSFVDDVAEIAIDIKDEEQLESLPRVSKTGYPQGAMKITEGDSVSLSPDTMRWKPLYAIAYLARTMLRDVFDVDVTYVHMSAGMGCDDLHRILTNRESTLDIGNAGANFMKMADSLVCHDIDPSAGRGVFGIVPSTGRGVFGIDELNLWNRLVQDGSSLGDFLKVDGSAIASRSTKQSKRQMEKQMEKQMENINNWKKFVDMLPSLGKYVDQFVSSEKDEETHDVKGRKDKWDPSLNDFYSRKIANTLAPRVIYTSKNNALVRLTMSAQRTRTSVDVFRFKLGTHRFAIPPPIAVKGNLHSPKYYPFPRAVWNDIGAHRVSVFTGTFERVGSRGFTRSLSGQQQDADADAVVQSLTLSSELVAVVEDSTVRTAPFAAPIGPDIRSLANPAPCDIIMRVGDKIKSTNIARYIVLDDTYTNEWSESTPTSLVFDTSLLVYGPLMNAEVHRSVPIYAKQPVVEKLDPKMEDIARECAALKYEVYRIEGQASRITDKGRDALNEYVERIAKLESKLEPYDPSIKRDPPTFVLADAINTDGMTEMHTLQCVAVYEAVSYRPTDLPRSFMGEKPPAIPHSSQVDSGVCPNELERLDADSTVPPTETPRGAPPPPPHNPKATPGTKDFAVGKWKQWNSMPKDSRPLFTWERDTVVPDVVSCSLSVPTSDIQQCITFPGKFEVPRKSPKFPDMILAIRGIGERPWDCEVRLLVDAKIDKCPTQMLQKTTFASLQKPTSMYIVGDASEAIQVRAPCPIKNAHVYTLSKPTERVELAHDPVGSARIVAETEAAKYDVVEVAGSTISVIVEHKQDESSLLVFNLQGGEPVMRIHIPMDYDISTFQEGTLWKTSQSAVRTMEPVDMSVGGAVVLHVPDIDAISVGLRKERSEGYAQLKQFEEQIRRLFKIETWIIAGNILEMVNSLSRAMEYFDPTEPTVKQLFEITPSKERLKDAISLFDVTLKEMRALDSGDEQPASEMLRAFYLDHEDVEAPPIGEDIYDAVRRLFYATVSSAIGTEKLDTSVKRTVEGLITKTVSNIKDLVGPAVKGDRVYQSNARDLVQQSAERASIFYLYLDLAHELLKSIWDSDNSFEGYKDLAKALESLSKVALQPEKDIIGNFANLKNTVDKLVKRIPGFTIDDDVKKHASEQLSDLAASLAANLKNAAPMEKLDLVSHVGTDLLNPGGSVLIAVGTDDEEGSDPGSVSGDSESDPDSGSESEAEEDAGGDDFDFGDDFGWTEDGGFSIDAWNLRGPVGAFDVDASLDDMKSRSWTAEYFAAKASNTDWCNEQLKNVNTGNDQILVAARHLRKVIAENSKAVDVLTKKTIKILRNQLALNYWHSEGIDGVLGALRGWHQESFAIADRIGDISASWAASIAQNQRESPGIKKKYMPMIESSVDEGPAVSTLLSGLRERLWLGVASAASVMLATIFEALKIGTTEAPGNAERVEGRVAIDLFVATQTTRMSRVRDIIGAIDTTRFMVEFIAVCEALHRTVGLIALNPNNESAESPIFPERAREVLFNCKLNVSRANSYLFLSAAHDYIEILSPIDGAPLFPPRGDQPWTEMERDRYIGVFNTFGKLSMQVIESYKIGVGFERDSIDVALIYLGANEEALRVVSDQVLSLQQYFTAVFRQVRMFLREAMLSVPGQYMAFCNSYIEQAYELVKIEDALLMRDVVAPYVWNPTTIASARRSLRRYLRHVKSMEVVLQSILSRHPRIFDGTSAQEITVWMDYFSTIHAGVDIMMSRTKFFEDGQGDPVSMSDDVQTTIFDLMMARSSAMQNVTMLELRKLYYTPGIGGGLFAIDVAFMSDEFLGGPLNAAKLLHGHIVQSYVFCEARKSKPWTSIVARKEREWKVQRARDISYILAGEADIRDMVRYTMKVCSTLSTSEKSQTIQKTWDGIDDPRRPHSDFLAKNRKLESLLIDSNELLDLSCVAPQWDSHKCKAFCTSRERSDQWFLTMIISKMMLIRQKLIELRSGLNTKYSKYADRVLAYDLITDDTQRLEKDTANEVEQTQRVVSFHEGIPFESLPQYARPAYPETQAVHRMMFWIDVCIQAQRTALATVTNARRVTPVLWEADKEGPTTYHTEVVRTERGRVMGVLETALDTWGNVSRARNHASIESVPFGVHSRRMLAKCQNENALLLEEHERLHTLQNPVKETRMDSLRYSDLVANSLCSEISCMLQSSLRSNDTNTKTPPLMLDIPTGAQRFAAFPDVKDTQSEYSQAEKDGVIALFKKIDDIITSAQRTLKEESSGIPGTVLVLSYMETTLKKIDTELQSDESNPYKRKNIRDTDMVYTVLGTYAFDRIATFVSSWIGNDLFGEFEKAAKDTTTNVPGEGGRGSRHILYTTDQFWDSRRRIVPRLIDALMNIKLQCRMMTEAYMGSNFFIAMRAYSQTIINNREIANLQVIYNEVVAQLESLIGSHSSRAVSRLDTTTVSSYASRDKVMDDRRKQVPISPFQVRKELIDRIAACQRSISLLKDMVSDLSKNIDPEANEPRSKRRRMDDGSSAATISQFRAALEFLRIAAESQAQYTSAIWTFARALNCVLNLKLLANIEDAFDLVTVTQKTSDNLKTLKKFAKEVVPDYKDTLSNIENMRTEKVLSITEATVQVVYAIEIAMSKGVYDKFIDLDEGLKGYISRYNQMLKTLHERFEVVAEPSEAVKVVGSVGTAMQRVRATFVTVSDMLGDMATKLQGVVYDNDVRKSYVYVFEDFINKPELRRNMSELCNACSDLMDIRKFIMPESKPSTEDVKKFVADIIRSLWDSLDVLIPKFTRPQYKAGGAIMAPSKTSQDTPNFWTSYDALPFIDQTHWQHDSREYVITPRSTILGTSTLMELREDCIAIVKEHGLQTHFDLGPSQYLSHMKATSLFIEASRYDWGHLANNLELMISIDYHNRKITKIIKDIQGGTTEPFLSNQLDESWKGVVILLRAFETAVLEMQTVKMIDTESPLSKTLARVAGGQSPSNIEFSARYLQNMMLVLRKYRDFVVLRNEHAKSDKPGKGVDAGAIHHAKALAYDIELLKALAYDIELLKAQKLIGQTLIDRDSKQSVLKQSFGPLENMLFGKLSTELTRFLSALEKKKKKRGRTIDMFTSAQVHDYDTLVCTNTQRTGSMCTSSNNLGSQDTERMEDTLVRLRLLRDQWNYTVRDMADLPGRIKEYFDLRVQSDNDPVCNSYLIDSDLGNLQIWKDQIASLYKSSETIYTEAKSIRGTLPDEMLSIPSVIIGSFESWVKVTWSVAIRGLLLRALEHCSNAESELGAIVESAMEVNAHYGDDTKIGPTFFSPVQRMNAEYIMRIVEAISLAILSLQYTPIDSDRTRNREVNMLLALISSRCVYVLLSSSWESAERTTHGISQLMDDISGGLERKRSLAYPVEEFSDEITRITRMCENVVRQSVGMLPVENFVEDPRSALAAASYVERELYRTGKLIYVSLRAATRYFHTWIMDLYLKFVSLMWPLIVVAFDGRERSMSEKLLDLNGVRETSRIARKAIELYKQHGKNMVDDKRVGFERDAKSLEEIQSRLLEILDNPLASVENIGPLPCEYGTVLCSGGIIGHVQEKLTDLLLGDVLEGDEVAAVIVENIGKRGCKALEFCKSRILACGIDGFDAPMRSVSLDGTFQAEYTVDRSLMSTLGTLTFYVNNPNGSTKKYGFNNPTAVILVDYENRNLCRIPLTLKEGPDTNCKVFANSGRNKEIVARVIVESGNAEITQAMNSGGVVIGCICDAGALHYAVAKNPTTYG